MDNNNCFHKITITLEDVKSNINVINGLREHFRILLSTNIVYQNKYNDNMDKLKFLNNESNNHLKSLNIIYKIINLTDKKNSDYIDCDLIDNKINSIEVNSLTIKNELIKIIFDYGFTNISSILYIIDSFVYFKNKINLEKKISLIENFFQVIKVEKINREHCNEIYIRIKNIMPEPVKKLPVLASSDKNKLENSFIDNDEKLLVNLIYELNKAIIEIEIDDCIYIFNGFFKEDIFNEIYQNEIFEFKFKNIQKKLFDSEKVDNKFKTFFKEYMLQLSVKDFIVCDEDIIIEKIKNMYSLSNRIEKISVIDLLNEFVEKNIYHKRNMIIVLLLNDQSLDILIDNLFDKEQDKFNSDEPFVKIFKIENTDDTSEQDSGTDLSSPILKTKKNNINDDSNNKNNKKKESSFDNGIKNFFLKDKDDQIVFKNPLPIVKLNKATATRYGINSIMKNFDTNNDFRNLSSILSNSKKIVNANILMDFLKNSIFKSKDYENFLGSIYWNYRKKIFVKNLSDSKQKNQEEVTWETKISLMEISEKAKDKVNEKIKEVRSSKDNAKAETFIESFFKIPFGIFIKEDIFVRSTNSNLKMKRLVDMINSHIELTGDKIHVSDSIEQLKNRTLTYRLLYDIDNYYWDLIEEKKIIIKEKNLYMEKVDKILEDAIYGHKNSKREIKRLIAQWMGGKMEGAILGFHGPPGVGKTCFAKKGISKCLFDSNGNSRPFCIFQLGGSTDGSILEGHSYTYVGAKPGRLIEFLQETKCMNPIIYFDELDKVSETDKGKEIIDILIHLTDKSQNKEIFDKYFSGIELDFSKCVIIFSYNDASKVNRILRDRITEIKINPLKKNEKIVITKNYTLKEISDEVNYNCVLSDELIEYIIDTYTFEAGIRKLNEKLYEIFREINLQVLENPYLNLQINKDFIDEILTRHHKVKHYKIHLTPQVGLINGLYASTVGLGGVTLIQIKKILTSSNSMPLELTGQQGDVMKESMSCAKTLALNLLSDVEKESLNIELKSNQFGLHIHCPDGATPKDGPSAGITITTGIYSALTGKKVRNDIAMTGEVDLLGNVKAIGGLDTKINGAIKAGVRMVIFPKENEEDWDKIVKTNALDGTIEIFMAETIDQVIEKAIIQ